MEIKAELQKATEKERTDFIIEYNRKLGYSIEEEEIEIESDDEYKIKTKYYHLIARGYSDEEKLQNAKKAKYDEALTGAKNFIENNAVFQFDENNSIEATDGNIAKMTAYALGFQTGAIEYVYWTSKEDNVLTLNSQDVLRILTGLGKIQGNIWNVQFVAYKNAIENALTTEEVEAINISYESGDLS